MRQIIKQPDGLYAEYSTIVDSFILTDCTKEEIIKNAEKEAADKARKDCEAVFTDIEKGIDFSLRWDEAVKNHNKNCSPEERIEIK
ncbi:MAG: hypothetical protein M0R32_10505 [Candidatus Cloacimonetes bacterium]|jgi:hypothetical protein|nr:hypothetical protein [Candidatus Cloacimonadota bacterium]